MFLSNSFLLSNSRILLFISGHHNLIDKGLRTANQQSNCFFYITSKFVMSIKCSEILDSHSRRIEDSMFLVLCSLTLIFLAHYSN